MKLLLAIFSILLPQKLKKWVYRRYFSWEIADSARIGRSFLYVTHAVLGEQASIGSFNVIRHLQRLELGPGANIGNMNYITAAPFHSEKKFCALEERVAGLVLEENASVTGRHFFDCNALITIGAYTVIAGRESCFYTHGIDIVTNRQTIASITIGKYCMLGARCMVVKGAALPDFSMLGAQSVLHKPMLERYMLYAGNPAQPVKQLNRQSAFFSREVGWVD